MIFDLTGKQTRARRNPCKQCGAMRECDICWGEVFDWTPFVIRHCFVCQMPQAFFDGGASAMNCDFCGAHETDFVNVVPRRDK